MICVPEANPQTSYVVRFSLAKKIMVVLLAGVAGFLAFAYALNFTAYGNLGNLLRGEKMHFDTALPPIAITELKSVLDKDLGEAERNGQLAPSTGAGVSIAVVQHGIARVFSYGSAKPDSIFEIGSLTKTFTGLILSQMVQQGEVSLNEPVRQLLPSGVAAKPGGAEITLLDLATQHSGLPRLPDNLHPADPANPYADYGTAELYAFLAKRSVAKPADAGFLYSNLGFGLLGQALANRASLPYSEVLRNQVTGPLGLNDTVVQLSPEQRSRFIPGYDRNHRLASPWDFGALAGAGAIRSTAVDMLKYLEAQLHPETLKLSDQKAAATLAEAITSQHQVRAEADPGMRIALGWLYAPGSGSYWHNGGTGGFSSFALFNPQEDYAVVVLFNTALGPKGSFADRLGSHISARLSGKPAISLSD